METHLRKVINPAVMAKEGRGGGADETYSWKVISVSTDSPLNSYSTPQGTSSSEVG